MADFTYDKIAKKIRKEHSADYWAADVQKEIAFKEIDYISDCLKVLMEKYYDLTHEEKWEIAQYANRDEVLLSKWESAKHLFYNIESAIAIVGAEMDLQFHDDEYED